MSDSTTFASSSGEATAATLPRPYATSEEASQLPATLQLRYAAWLRISAQFERAAELLDLVERLSGNSAGLLDERAALALARFDASAVHETWQHRLLERPAPSAQASYARALLELGEIQEAAAIAEELVTHHPELATVQSLYAEVALLQGDLATAHDYWSVAMERDPSRTAPKLAMARVALLGGDFDDARSFLSQAIEDGSVLTAAQLATAAGLAELLGQPARSQSLRLRFAHVEAERTHALANEIDTALGRTPATENGRAVERLEPRTGGNPASSSRSDPKDPGPLIDVANELANETMNDPRVLETLHKVFGHEALLPGQAAVINQVLAGQDTLAILPTGAGKSLTFQLSSLLLPGTTLVISPLIALMKDQIDGLPPRLREQSILVNSTLSPDEQRRALESIASGERKLAYAAPERLRQPSFLRALKEGGVSLVVVDEAHCISLWGHDFRPDYLSIPAALPELGDPPLLAMTATASPDTAASLSAGFRRDLAVVRTTSFRSNLFYAAERWGSKEEKARRVVALCRELRGSGIVYVSSRRDAENLAGVLCDNGVGAVAYHAGMERERRAANQDRFMSGAARVVVATVAFGMGIDKSDVRFIIHFSPSTSLEAYAQESGRAGRDGQDSRCVLLFTSSDRANQTRLARRDAMDLDALRQVYAGVKRHATGAWAIFDPSRISLRLRPDDDPDEAPDPRIGIGLLEQGGLLERHPNAPVNWTLTRVETAALDEPTSIADDAAIWPRFSEWAGLSETRHNRVVIQTAAACSALGLSPAALALVLDVQAFWRVSEGDRLTCLQLLPVEANAGARLQRVLDDAAVRAKARVDRTMTYAEGRRCRHAELAAHLGERLLPCGSACDVCAGGQSSVVKERGRAEPQPKKRSAHTAADAEAALKALATAPFPVGKTGLTRLLEGSIQSRIQADRSRYFGALADLQKSKIDAMIDRLVQENLLVHDHSRAFPVLRLTPRGEDQIRQGSDIE